MGPLNSWERLALLLRLMRPPDGLDGLRDVDSSCDAFLEGVPSRDCEGDGHYLCKECKNFDRARSKGE